MVAELGAVEAALVGVDERLLGDVLAAPAAPAALLQLRQRRVDEHRHRAAQDDVVAAATSSSSVAARYVSACARSCMLRMTSHRTMTECVKLLHTYRLLLPIALFSLLNDDVISGSS